MPCLASTPEGSSTSRLLTSSESPQVEVIYWRANVVIELVGRVGAGWMLEVPVSLDADVAGVEILVQQAAAASVKALGFVGAYFFFVSKCRRCKHGSGLRFSSQTIVRLRVLFSPL